MKIQKFLLDTFYIFRYLGDLATNIEDETAYACVYLGENYDMNDFLNLEDCCLKHMDFTFTIHRDEFLCVWYKDYPYIVEDSDKIPNSIFNFGKYKEENLIYSKLKENDCYSFSDKKFKKVECDKISNVNIIEYPINYTYDEVYENLTEIIKFIKKHAKAMGSKSNYALTVVDVTGVLTNLDPVHKIINKRLNKDFNLNSFITYPPGIGMYLMYIFQDSLSFEDLEKDANDLPKVVGIWNCFGQIKQNSNKLTMIIPGYEDQNDYYYTDEDNFEKSKPSRPQYNIPGNVLDWKICQDYKTKSRSKKK